MDSLHYYGYIQGEIGKARTQRDLAVAQLTLGAADALAGYLVRIIRIFRLGRIHHRARTDA